MRIEIGQEIARRRRERGVTQEQLAAAIGVSAPAVSKWESAQSYPDITLLAPLARFFGVTVDALLAYRPVITDAESQRLADGCADSFAAEGWEAGLARCGALEHEYPDNSRLKFYLALALQRSQLFVLGAAERRALREREVALLLAVTGCGDHDLQAPAAYLLACVHLELGQHQAAGAVLDRLPTAEYDPRQLRPTVYLRQGDWEQAERCLQENLFTALRQASNALLGLINLATQQADLGRAERMADSHRRLLQLFQLDQVLGGTLAIADVLAAGAGPAATRLAALEQLVDSLGPAQPSTGSPCFGRLQLPIRPSDAGWERAMRRQLAADLRQNVCYADLREEARFQALLRRLELEANQPSSRFTGQ